MKYLSVLGFLVGAFLTVGFWSEQGQPDYQKTYEFQHPVYNLSDSLFAAGAYDEAVFALDSVAQLLKENNEIEGSLNVFNRLGFFQRRLRNWEGAEQILRKVAREGKSLFDDNHPIVGTAYFYLGGLYDRLGEPEKALAYLDSAQQSRRNFFGENSTELSNVYIAIGDVFRFNFADYENASENYLKALSIQERLLDKEDNQLMTNYYNIGSILRLKGEFDEALIYAQQAKNSFIQSPTVSANMKANTFMLVGNIYFGKEEYQLAIREYERAIEIAKSDEIVQNNLGDFYNSIGAAYRSLDSMQQAKDFYTLALEDIESRFGPNSIRLSFPLDNLGLIYLDENILDSAMMAFDRSLAKKELNPSQFKSEIAKVLRFKGNIYLRKQEYDNALVQFQKAINEITNENQTPFEPTLAQLEDQELLKNLIFKGSTLTEIAKTKNNQDEKLEILQIGLNELATAENILTKLRQSSDRDGTKLLLSEFYKGLYEEALNSSYLIYELTNSRNYLDSAYKFLSKSKGLSLLETLSGTEAGLSLNLPKDILDKENALKADIAALSLRLSRARASGNQDSILQILNSNLLSLIREQESFKSYLAENHPNYYELKYRYDYPKIEDLQAWAKRRNGKILEYFYGDRNIYIIGVSEKEISFHTLARDSISDSHLIQYSNQLKQGFNFSTQREDFNTFTRTAYFIFKDLVKPVLSVDTDQKNILQNLIIIPDGYLAALPFDALLTQEVNVSNDVDYRNLPYLHNDYIISYHFNSSLGIMNNIDELRSSKSMLAFSYSDEDVMKMSAEEILKSNQISGSAEEIAKINDIIPNVRVFTGKEASEENFHLKASAFDIIHLAIHGEADTLNALESRLIFPTAGIGHDGILHPYELYNLNLSAQLVVLSACESGLGKLNSGEGIFSMARAFAFAGAPSIVMSLWKVNDRTTSQLMGNFYRSLVESISIDIALHETKTAYIKQADELTAHPANWAAIVPIGNMSGFKWFKGIGTSYLLILIGGGGMASLITLAFFYKRAQRKH